MNVIKEKLRWEDLTMIGFKHLIGRRITCFGAQIDTLIVLDAIIL